MRGKQKKRLLALLISLAMLFTLTPFTNVAAADDFTADSGVFNLVGESINDHTNAYYLWEYDNWVYIALVTANHTTTTTLTVNSQTVTERWFLTPGEALIVKDDSDIIFSEIPTGKNTGTDYYWMVGRLPLAGLDLSNLIISLYAPGGFKLDNVRYTVVGALNVYHEYLYDPPELDLDQSVGSNSLAGLAAGTYEADPVTKGDYVYIGVDVFVGGTSLFSAASGSTGSGTSGVVSVAVDAAGKVMVTLSADYDGVIKILYQYEEQVNIDVSKVWQDDDNEDLRPDNITVRLWQAVGAGTATEVDDMTIEPDMDGNWADTFTGQPKYDSEGQPYIYSITEDSIDNYDSGITGDAEEGFEITNTRTGLIDIDVSKVWLDDDAEDLRPDDITVRLWQAVGAGTATEVDDMTIEPDMDGNWADTFENQDMYDNLGRLYIYSITEDSIGGYASVITGDADEGFEITNTVTGLIDIDVSKVWQDDDAEDLRPDDITVRLWQAVGAGTASEVDDMTIEPDMDGNWADTFENQDMYDNLGRLYIYSITEDSISGYASVITGDADEGFEITNTLTGETEVTVTKTWVGDEDDLEMRPDSITVRLWRAVGDEDPDEIDSDSFGASEDWTIDFTGLDMYDEFGRLYIYSITEDAVTGYTTVIDGFSVTNTAIIIPVITITTDPIPLVQPTTTAPPAAPTTIKIVTEPIPKAGESGPLWPIGVVLLALAGGISLILHQSNRKNEQKEKNRK